MLGHGCNSQITETKPKEQSVFGNQLIRFITPFWCWKRFTCDQPILPESLCFHFIEKQSPTAFMAGCSSAKSWWNANFWVDDRLRPSANWGAIMSYYFNFPLLCILIQYYVILCQYYFTYFIYSFWTIMSYYVTSLKSALISIMSVVLFQLFYFVILYILWQLYNY